MDTTDTVDLDALDEDVRDAIEGSTIPTEALVLFADNQHADLTVDVIADAEDHYMGSAWSLTGWAEEYVDDTGLLLALDEDLRSYFDYKAWADDAVLSGDIYVLTEEDGYKHVFHG